MRFGSIILAAGQGRRMQSDLPKVLHQVDARPMLQWVLQAASEAGVEHHVAVVGHGRELVEASLARSNLSFAVQKQQLGTGHAVLCAESQAEGLEAALILCGDTPCLKSATLSEFLKRFACGGASLSVLSTRLANPAGYGRVLRNTQGHFVAIREERDCTPKEREIQEVNTGIYAVKVPELFEWLRGVGNQNAQQEYYLTDIVTVARERGFEISAECLDEPDQFLGVNNPDQLQEAELVLQARKRS